MKKTDIDQNWWRAIVAPIAVTSAVIVAACISGLPSISCAALAKTYSTAIYNFGFTAALASSLFLLSMLVSAFADSKKMPTYIPGVIAAGASIVFFASAMSVGIDSLEASIAVCYAEHTPKT